MRRFTFTFSFGTFSFIAYRFSTFSFAVRRPALSVLTVLAPTCCALSVFALSDTDWAVRCHVTREHTRNFKFYGLPVQHLKLRNNLERAPVLHSSRSRI